MTDNQRRILEMLAEKKISVDEAYRLLSLVDSPPDAASEKPGATSGQRQSPKYLRVVVQPNNEEGSGDGGERVNIRVPMTLIRAGMKLTSIIPPQATDQVNEALRGQGIDLDLRNLKADDLEELVGALADLEVDVQSGKEKVHIYVE